MEIEKVKQNGGDALAAREHISQQERVRFYTRYEALQAADDQISEELF